MKKSPFIKNSLNTLFTHLSFELINIYNHLTEEININIKGQKYTFICNVFLQLFL